MDRVHRRGTCLSAGVCSLAQVLRAGLRARDAHVMCSLKPFAICLCCCSSATFEKQCSVASGLHSRVCAGLDRTQ